MNIKINQITIVFWAALVSAFYYASFPFIELFSGLPVLTCFKPSFAIIEHLLILVFILISANGWAAFIWFNADLSHIERLLFSTAAGFGIISFIVFIFGMIGVISSLVYFLVLFAGFMLMVASGKQLHARLLPKFNLVFLLMLLPVISTLIGALSPPTQFDSLVYHLALPYRYILAKKFIAVPHNFFFSFPQNMEMLYQLAIKIDCDILANLVHWSFFPLTALAIHSFGVRFWDNKTAAIASIVWLFTPASMFISTGTYVDLGLAFFVFTGVYAYFIWRETGNSRFLALCGLCSGLACGVKYTAAVNVLILAVLILFSPKHRGNELEGAGYVRAGFSPRFQEAAKYLLITLLAFSPWLIKNIIFLQNPVSPWGTGIFANDLINSAQADFYFKHIAGHGIGIKGIRDLISLPWSVTFSGYMFGGGFDILGPLFLLFLPALFLGNKIDKIDKILLIYSAIFVILWILTGKVMRFLLPVMPFFCLMTGRGIVSFSGFEVHKYARGALYLVFALALVHNLLMYHWVMASIDPCASVSGKLSRKEYLSKRLNYFSAADTVLNALSKKSRTVFIGETRSYYCSGNVIVPTDFDSNPLIESANGASNDRKLLEMLASERITHVFINNYEFERLSMKARFTPKGFNNWLNLKNNRSKLIFEDKYCQLYELNY